MGEWLRSEGLMPDRALVSAALRTRETWALVTDELGEIPADVLQELHGATPEVMLRVLGRAPEIRTLLMLGHQPGIGAFARQLLDAPPADAAFDKYPTAATAIIDFAADRWSEVGWGAGRLVAFKVPRELD